MEATLKRDEYETQDAETGETLVVAEPEWSQPTDLVGVLATLWLDGLDLEEITTRANEKFYMGMLPGIENPQVTPDGRPLDSDRKRAYLQSDIQALLDTDDVKDRVEQIRAEQEEWNAELKRERRNRQLADARLAKHRKGERELMPDLVARVEQLEAQVERLLDAVDRGVISANVQEPVTSMRRR